GGRGRRLARAGLEWGGSAARWGSEWRGLAEQPVSTAASEPVPEAAAVDASSSGLSTEVSAELSTVASTPSTPRPKRQRNWAELKRRWRAKQKQRAVVEPEAHP